MLEHARAYSRMPAHARAYSHAFPRIPVHARAIPFDFKPMSG